VISTNSSELMRCPNAAAESSESDVGWRARVWPEIVATRGRMSGWRHLMAEGRRGDLCI